MKSKNVVAGGHKATAEAAQELLWLGGNAFDAAVGAVFTAMVAESGVGALIKNSASASNRMTFMGVTSLSVSGFRPVLKGNQVARTSCLVFGNEVLPIDSLWQ